MGSRTSPGWGQVLPDLGNCTLPAPDIKAHRTCGPTGRARDSRESVRACGGASGTLPEHPFEYRGTPRVMGRRFGLSHPYSPRGESLFEVERVIQSQSALLVLHAVECAGRRLRVPVVELGALRVSVIGGCERWPNQWAGVGERRGSSTWSAHGPAPCKSSVTPDRTRSELAHFWWTRLAIPVCAPRRLKWRRMYELDTAAPGVQDRGQRASTAPARGV